MSEPRIDEVLLERLLPGVEKPARYTGHEWNAVFKDWDRVAVHVALAYPDVYEVGMSNLGFHILYEILNAREDTWAERVYAPWPDMTEAMRRAGLPLFSLEGRHPLAAFDLVGFSLPYELNLTNVLEMLDLGGIPIHAEERGLADPLIIAGGSGAYNPEPMVDFIDAFVVGEGEEVVGEIVEVWKDWRAAEGAREDLLRRLARVPGVYVPRFYRVHYATDGRVAAIEPVEEWVQMPVVKRVVDPLPPAPVRPVIPYVEAVHDRAMVEIMRGCTQGCRFCQAGSIYRPLRERSVEEIVETVDALLANTGYEELSLVSLSSADYGRIRELLETLIARYADPPLAVSLPSLRVDAFSVELARLFQGRRRSGLTFAPEAGSQRMRDVINKKVSEADLFRTVEAAYAYGWQHVKLYFMIGLPTEEDEDVASIADLVHQVLAIGREVHGRRARVNVSVATFVPKPHTPFQWEPLIDRETLERRQRILQERVRGRGIHLSWHDPRSSELEAVIARGDRRLGRVIERAWRAGARFDAWDETFRPDLWADAFEAEGIDPDFYARRPRSYDEVLPWDHISCGMEKRYLWREAERAKRGETTRDCREGCVGCGANVLIGCRG